MSDPQFRNTTAGPAFRHWMKSPDSSNSDGCLYVSAANDGSGRVALAESEDGPDGPVLVLSRDSWEAFRSGTTSGAFDHI
ncbi:DUF397 domain-containing protein [Micromonospora sp. NPDC048986]|uniref:DUF397 domain-containing protein n=1 Tax=Micromonospora sp. NPDC048986 TaxID=3155644 RepID=UPI0033C7CC59